MFRRNDLSPGSALLVLLAAWSLSAPFAHAKDRIRVFPSITVNQEYDTNVLREEDDEADWVTRIIPKLSFARESEQGHARVWLGLVSRLYAEFDELDGTDRYMKWDVDHSLNSRLSVFSEGRLMYLESQDAVADGDTLIGEGRPDQRQTQAGGGLRYTLSPMSSITASGGYFGRDYSSNSPDPRDARRDSDTRWGALSHNRVLNSTNRLSSSLQYQQTDFENIGVGSETDDMVSGTVQWDRAWSPIWSSTLSTGLRWLKADTDAGSNTTLGFVGGASLTRRFRRGEFNLSYQRETRPSSGLGSSLDTDTLRAAFKTRLSQRLRLEILGEYELFNSANETDFSVDPSVQQVGGLTVLNCPSGSTFEGGKCKGKTNDVIESGSVVASVRLDWQIRQRLFTFVRYRYQDQTSSGTRNVGEFDSHRIMLGFEFGYPFDMK